MDAFPPVFFGLDREDDIKVIGPAPGLAPEVISAHSGDPQRLAGPLPEIVDGLKFALQDPFFNRVDAGWISLFVGVPRRPLMISFQPCQETPVAPRACAESWRAIEAPAPTNESKACKRRTPLTPGLVDFNAAAKEPGSCCMSTEAPSPSMSDASSTTTASTKGLRKNSHRKGVAEVVAEYTLLVPEEHLTAFGFTPKLYGRNGENMKKIVAACGGKAKVRLRGQGSGFLEFRKREAQMPLHLYLSCPTRECYEVGHSEVKQLLKRLEMKFHRFCSENNLPAPIQFFTHAKIIDRCAPKLGCEKSLKPWCAHRPPASQSFFI
ncbi:KH homology domain-containing protein 4 (Brings lots of money 7) (Pre-mRNA splicing factor protein khdc4) [Durusdinium trenchii]|uniref:KH homology domain-containing protein 4 (Brings lots of money 7) (Pre-mRNA splicing factor protein khdc4) n=1 Tax=Durusdinium trenchii TaxID=1381693 RepID=A0ABP0SG18_9DINO